MTSTDRPPTPEQSRESVDAVVPSPAEPAPVERQPTFVKKGLDTARSIKVKRKNKASGKEVDFFERDAVVIDDIPTPKDATTIDYQAIMLKNLENAPTSRRPQRIDQGSPWSVSVAESPEDNRSYSLYVKTATHNLTLTRTAMEIVEFDHKLRDSDLGVDLPALPLNAASITAQTPPKRKSTFLNTLSRLASPTSNRSRNPSSRSTSNVSGAPMVTASESTDPFLSFSVSNIDASLPAPSTTSTALSSYFTTVSNLTGVRQSRVWKRFVRVRTDDLESVRVERAIKRVRSDLAAHTGLGKGDKENRPSVEVHRAIHEKIASQQENHEVKAPLASEEALEADAESMEGIENGMHGSSPSAAPAEEAVVPVRPSPAKAEEEEPQTPSASEGPSVSRVRSLSADPDKRISRAFVSSDLDPQSGMSSQTETGDESSISASKRRARKKRSMSTDPNAELKKKSRKVVVSDFEMMRVLGKGCAGKVLLVRHKTSTELYAMKAITKRHVLAHQELQHTLTEQAVLKRMAAESKDPFVVKLWWSFHDKDNLFLVMDFHPGGDLATQLARWGRLGRDRARFYAAEIVEGVEGLHAAGVIYRDLKPENILIGGDGHIVLTDFGLSKEFPRRVTAATAPSTPSGTRSDAFNTALPASPPWMKPDKSGEMALGWPGAPIGHNDSTTTFCGTAEYLAPEVIQGLAYSYEIDWWSFGTMLYEMLTGITPFWANNHSDMYVRVLQDELQFPDDRAIDQDTKSLIRGLLQRNPGLRICEPRIKRHPYFSMIDWSHVYYKRYIPPYIPPLDPLNAGDTQNFDDTFLDMEPVLDDANEADGTDTDQEREQTDTDRTDGEESNTTPSQSRSSSIHPMKNTPDEEEVDVFDGYSFKGRHSVLLDDDDDEEDSSEQGTDGDSEEENSAANSLEQPAAPSPNVPLAPEDDEDADGVEPKTPEARPITLPPDTQVAPQTPPEPAQIPLPEDEPVDSPLPEVVPSPPVEDPIVEPVVPVIPVRGDTEKETPPLPPVLPEKEEPVKAVVPPKAIPKATRGKRREKSGVAALDRLMSDVETGAGEADEEDEEDDGWDLIDTVDGEDRNGAKGTSYFARGVVDRYKLAVVFKKSTPSRSQNFRPFSTVSKDSEPTAGANGPDSPTPSQRRGRTGMNFRKNPREFLRARSPPSTFSAKSAKSSLTGKSMNASTSTSLSAASSSGLLVPSQSGTSTAVSAESPSLKSKESAVSMGAQSATSDQSGNGDVSETAGHNSARVSTSEEPEKQKNKKLKKYKENAEKVFSLFSSSSSPRQHS